MWVRLLESGGRRVLLSWEQWHLWLQMSRQSCWDSNAKPWQRVKLWSHSLCLLRCWFDFSTIHLCSKRHLENIQEKHSRQKRSRVAARASWNQYKNKYHWMHFWKETLGITSPKSLTSTHLWRLMRVGLVWLFWGEWKSPSWVALVLFGLPLRCLLLRGWKLPFASSLERQKVCGFDAYQIQHNRKSFDFCFQATHAISVFLFICASGSLVLAVQKRRDCFKWLQTNFVKSINTLMN